MANVFSWCNNTGKGLWRGAPAGDKCVHPNIHMRRWSQWGFSSTIEFMKFYMKILSNFLWIEKCIKKYLKRTLRLSSENGRNNFVFGIVSMNSFLRKRSFCSFEAYYLVKCFYYSINTTTDSAWLFCPRVMNDSDIPFTFPGLVSVNCSWPVLLNSQLLEGVCSFAAASWVLWYPQYHHGQGTLLPFLFIFFNLTHSLLLTSIWTIVFLPFICKESGYYFIESFYLSMNVLWTKYTK